MKILFAASSGGHLEEILRLRDLTTPDNTILLTEKVNYTLHPWQKTVYVVPQVNRRDPACALKLLANGWISLRVLAREKPDVVISTGALATLPVCLLCRLFRCRLIYIESLTRIERLSMTGKVLYRLADVFVVQWEELQKRCPKAVCWGVIV